MLDWVTLRFIEHAPDAVWIITGVISVAILARPSIEGVA